MHSLEGKTAVVTGAASGIGLGATEALASRGARVVMADIEAEPLEREAERLSRANLAVLPIRTDVASFESVRALAHATKDRFGPVHVLFNNAGVSGAGARPIWEMDEGDWNWVLGVNLMGVVNGLRAFTPEMIAHGEEGHIVNTSSILGLTTGAGSIYGVSKHAVTRLTEGLYLDLKAAGARISASVLCPGLIATNIIMSARNRPEGANPTSGDLARQQALAHMDKYFKDNGMAPRHVGELVVDAILNDRFYVFTHAENMEGVRRRFDDIANLRPPLRPANPITS